MQWAKMLSAFTALPIVELKQRDKSKIESLLTYGKVAVPVLALKRANSRPVQVTSCL